MTARARGLIVLVAAVVAFGVAFAVGSQTGGAEGAPKPASAETFVISNEKPEPLKLGAVGPIPKLERKPEPPSPEPVDGGTGDAAAPPSSDTPVEPPATPPSSPPAPPPPPDNDPPPVIFD